jgi:hypothetical protein
MILKKIPLLVVFFILIIPFGVSEEEIAPAPDYSTIEEELAALEKASDSSENGSMIKVVLVILAIVALLIVMFFLYRNLKKEDVASEASVENTI